MDLAVRLVQHLNITSSANRTHCRSRKLIQIRGFQENLTVAGVTLKGHKFTEKCENDFESDHNLEKSLSSLK